MKDIEKIFKDEGDNVALEEVVHQMELLAQTKYVNPFDMAMRYSWLNQHEKALDWIEKGFEFHDPNAPYLTLGLFVINELYDNPRFIAILEKMNLPLPRD